MIKSWELTLSLSKAEQSKFISRSYYCQSLHFTGLQLKGLGSRCWESLAWNGNVWSSILQAMWCRAADVTNAIDQSEQQGSHTAEVKRGTRSNRNGMNRSQRMNRTHPFLFHKTSLSVMCCCNLSLTIIQLPFKTHKEWFKWSNNTFTKVPECFGTGMLTKYAFTRYIIPELMVYIDEAPHLNLSSMIPCLGVPWFRFPAATLAPSHRGVLGDIAPAIMGVPPPAGDQVCPLG